MICDTRAKVNNCIVSYSSPFCRAYIPVDDETDTENEYKIIKIDTILRKNEVKTPCFDNTIYNNLIQRGIKWT